MFHAPAPHTGPVTARENWSKGTDCLKGPRPTKPLPLRAAGPPALPSMPTSGALLTALKGDHLLTPHRGSAEHVSVPFCYLVNLANPPSALETTAPGHVMFSITWHPERTHSRPDASLAMFAFLFHLDRLVPSLPSLAHIPTPASCPSRRSLPSCDDLTCLLVVQCAVPVSQHLEGPRDGNS